MCSIGWPRPRSVASDSEATSSASRTWDEWATCSTLDMSIPHRGDRDKPTADHPAAPESFRMKRKRSREPLPVDYDRNPERFRLARSVLREHACAEDIHAQVARRLLTEGLTPVLDVGCGEGELARHLPDGAWVGVDSSLEMLARAPEPKLLADATALPFDEGSFGSVAMLYVLYHLPEPRLALAEAARVLRPGGLLAVAAPSRYDSPELAHALPETALTFDAELGPALVGELFGEVQVERWDTALLELPDREAVRDYLVGKGVAPDRAALGAESVEAPLSVTKRGALLFARA
jgi:SAM-dependent methyltransferase